VGNVARGDRLLGHRVCGVDEPHLPRHRGERAPAPARRPRSAPT
jgi:hypothetical protein